MPTQSSRKKKGVIFELLTFIRRNDDVMLSLLILACIVLRLKFYYKEKFFLLKSIRMEDFGMNSFSSTHFLEF